MEGRRGGGGWKVLGRGEVVEVEWEGGGRKGKRNIIGESQDARGV